jgi:hypothetical protein
MGLLYHDFAPAPKIVIVNNYQPDSENQSRCPDFCGIIFGAQVIVKMTMVA